MKGIPKRLGDNIRYIRVQKGLSLDMLAKKVRVDKGYLSRVENGKNNPTLSTLIKLADALEVSIVGLFK